MTLTSRPRFTMVLVAALAWVLLAVLSVSGQGRSVGERRHTINIRGRDQVLHLYGNRGDAPVIVSSGDGGWIHLGPHVAGTLAAQRFFVVGFDARSYLESFTTGATTLRPDDEPADYGMLIEFAPEASGAARKPVLIGVSEGAGLSVLAAANPRNQGAIAGVVGLGLSDLTELGWRWRDMAIYITHGTPREPTFSVKSVVDRMAPVPLAAIHSTHDEYVPVSEVQDVLARAREPKRLWVVRASNHRFSDNLAEFDQALVEAIRWTTQGAEALNHSCCRVIRDPRARDGSGAGSGAAQAPAAPLPSSERTPR